MFISNIHGQEKINAMAASIGIKAGETHFGGYAGNPALVGNTFKFKDQIKAAGAKWCAAEKAWTFESVEKLEAALTSIIGA